MIRAGMPVSFHMMIREFTRAFCLCLTCKVAFVDLSLNFRLTPGVSPLSLGCSKKAHYRFFLVKNRQRFGLTLQRGASCYSHCDVPSMWHESQCNHRHDVNIHALKYAGHSLKCIVRDGINQRLSLSLTVSMSHGACERASLTSEWIGARWDVRLALARNRWMSRACVHSRWAVIPAMLEAV